MSLQRNSGHRTFCCVTAQEVFVKIQGSDQLGGPLPKAAFVPIFQYEKKRGEKYVFFL